MSGLIESFLFNACGCIDSCVNISDKEIDWNLDASSDAEEHVLSLLIVLNPISLLIILNPE
jgi:hypothetical protein